MAENIGKVNFAEYGTFKNTLRHFFRRGTAGLIDFHGTPVGVCNLSAVEEWGNCIRLHISDVISPCGPTISSRFHEVSLHVDFISVTSGLSRRRIFFFVVFVFALSIMSRLEKTKQKTCSDVITSPMRSSLCCNKEDLGPRLPRHHE